MGTVSPAPPSSAPCWSDGSAPGSCVPGRSPSRPSWTSTPTPTRRSMPTTRRPGWQQRSGCATRPASTPTAAEHPRPATSTTSASTSTPTRADHPARPACNPRTAVPTAPPRQDLRRVHLPRLPDGSYRWTLPTGDPGHHRPTKATPQTLTAPRARHHPVIGPEARPPRLAALVLDHDEILRVHGPWTVDTAACALLESTPGACRPGRSRRSPASSSGSTTWIPAVHGSDRRPRSTASRLDVRLHRRAVSASHGRGPSRRSTCATVENHVDPRRPESLILMTHLDG